MSNRVNKALAQLNEQAAQLHAESWKSDPFAYSRMRMELDKGFHDYESHGRHEPGHKLVSDSAVGNISRRKAQINKEADAAIAYERELALKGRQK